MSFQILPMSFQLTEEEGAAQTKTVHSELDAIFFVGFLKCFFFKRQNIIILEKLSGVFYSPCHNHLFGFMVE